MTKADVKRPDLLKAEITLCLGLCSLQNNPSNFPGEYYGYH